MNAFYKFNTFLAKAYKKGNDWQVLSNGNAYPETWGSIWSDNTSGSLKRAMQRHCELNNIIFYDDESFYQVCK